MSITYLKNFFGDKHVGSVTPTSKGCVKRICDRMNLRDSDVVVEFGPGGGVFTRHILGQLGPEAKLIAIENNEDFHKELTSSKELQDPRVELVLGSAADAVNIFKDLGMDKADYIISGIPFAFLDGPLKREIIAAAAGILKNGGYFYTYQFFPPVYKKGEKLSKYISEELELKGKYFELPNIPPLYIYEAIKNGASSENGVVPQASPEMMSESLEG